MSNLKCHIANQLMATGSTKSRCLTGIIVWLLLAAHCLGDESLSFLTLEDTPEGPTITYEQRLEPLARKAKALYPEFFDRVSKTLEWRSATDAIGEPELVEEVVHRIAEELGMNSEIRSHLVTKMAEEFPEYHRGISLSGIYVVQDADSLIQSNFKDEQQLLTVTSDTCLVALSIEIKPNVVTANFEKLALFQGAESEKITEEQLVGARLEHAYDLCNRAHSTIESGILYIQILDTIFLEYEPFGKANPNARKFIFAAMDSIVLSLLSEFMGRIAALEGRNICLQIFSGASSYFEIDHSSLLESFSALERVREDDGANLLKDLFVKLNANSSSSISIASIDAAYHEIKGKSLLSTYPIFGGE